MFKDEAGGKQIVEFVGLRAKLYSYKMLDCSENKKCKGWQRILQKGVLNSMTTESAYLAGRNNRKMNVIRSNFHDIYTEEINKIALSSDDDKRVIMVDGIHTLAFGHSKLKKLQLQIMSYNEISNILVYSFVLPNKPISNLEIIGAAKRLSVNGFRSIFARHSP